MNFRTSCGVPFAAALVGVSWLAAPSSQIPSAQPRDRHASPVVTNDNRRAAGLMIEGALRLSLRAGRGAWQPEGNGGPAYEVEAFGETGGPLQVPAPLIRVRQGEAIAASVRNDLDHPLRVHGLCARDGSACPALEVPPGESREVRFAIGAAGTYHYWATTTGMPLAFRALDGQLSGALIVDPAQGPADADPVLVITEWTSLDRAQLRDVASRPDPGARFLELKPTVFYHTHLHDHRQLTSGLYGALLVVEPADGFDQTVDHVFVIGRGGPAHDAPAVINGSSAPQVVWNAGQRHRIRLINITPNDVLSVTLRTTAGPVVWRPVGKDGAAIPPERSAAQPGALTFGAGETYDFEYDAPKGRQTLWLEVRSPGGKWLAQGHVIVR